MSIDKSFSMFETFCNLIAGHLEGKGDFVLIADEVLSETAALSSLSEAEFVKGVPSVQAALLRAAGYALSGKKPWVLWNASELVGGGYLHIREAIAMPKLHVRLVAADCGLSCAPDGAAAQFLSDLAVMRTIPNMSLFVPSDLASLKGIMEKEEAISTPFYIRLGRSDAKELAAPSEEIFKLGGARILRSGTGVTICSCGIMVNQAICAAERLERQNISAEVIDCYCLKPFPEQALLSSVRKTGCCVVAEEHGNIGGLFGAVSECLGRTCPVPIRSVAVPDEFVNSGTPEELREYYGLTWKEIVDAAAQVWALRRR